MKTYTATNARSDFSLLIKETIHGHKEIKITSKEGGVILISEEDYENLLETLELLSVPGFRKKMEKAEKEIQKGEIFTMEEIFGKK